MGVRGWRSGGHNIHARPARRHSRAAGLGPPVRRRLRAPNPTAPVRLPASGPRIRVRQPGPVTCARPRTAPCRVHVLWVLLHRPLHPGGSRCRPVVLGVPQKLAHDMCLSPPFRPAPPCRALAPRATTCGSCRQHPHLAPVTLNKSMAALPSCSMMVTMSWLATVCSCRSGDSSRGKVSTYAGYPAAD